MNRDPSDANQASRAALEALIGPDGEPAPLTVLATFKDDRRSTVQLFEGASGRFIVKTYHGKPLLSTLAHLLRVSPAWREWRGAKRLREIGLRVNVPDLLVHERGKTIIIFPYVEGRSVHHLLHYGSANEHRPDVHRRQRLAAARQLGRQLGRMIAAGYANGDCKPSNLILDAEAEAGRCEPVIIDTVAIRPATDRRVYDMLSVLLLTSYRAGTATRRERLACLLEICRAGWREGPRKAMRELDRRLGTPPPVDPPYRKTPLVIPPPSSTRGD